MKFVGLDGRIYGIDPYNNVIPRQRSEGQNKLLELLIEALPSYKIIEEFQCPGTRNLRLDFYLPALSIAFEFDGRQHKEYVPHFHKNRVGFARSQNNDNDKQQWCEINQITLVRFQDKELNKKDFGNKIREATSNKRGN